MLNTSGENQSVYRAIFIILRNINLTNKTTRGSKSKMIEAFRILHSLKCIHRFTSNAVDEQ